MQPSSRVSSCLTLFLAHSVSFESHSDTGQRPTFGEGVPTETAPQTSRMRHAYLETSESALNPSGNVCCRLSTRGRPRRHKRFAACARSGSRIVVKASFLQNFRSPENVGHRAHVADPRCAFATQCCAHNEAVFDGLRHVSFW